MKHFELRVTTYYNGQFSCTHNLELEISALENLDQAGIDKLINDRVNSFYTQEVEVKHNLTPETIESYKKL